MLRNLLFNLTKRMALLTPQTYPKLATQFSEKPQISTLGEYFVPENVLELFNLVRDTEMDLSNRLNIYEKMEKQLFINNSDMEFNVLANIHKEKSTIYSQMNKIALAIEEIDKAILAIQAMEDPFSLQVAILYEMGATMYMKIEGHTKSQNYLSQAQYTLKLVQEEIQQEEGATSEAKEQQIKVIDEILARIYSSFCFLKMCQKKIVSAREYLALSLQKWDNAHNKNSLAYLFTIKYKCLLHLACRQQIEATNTALIYLQQIPEGDETMAHRMWFKKFLSDRGNEQYKQQLKQDIEALSKLMPASELNTLLIKLGLIRKKQNQ